MGDNCFFVPTRRRVGNQFWGKLCNRMYWITLGLMRFCLQPYLLYWFHSEVADPKFTPRDRLIVISSQAFLCTFNVGLAYLHWFRSPSERSHKSKNR